ncbi:hypothetical protein PFY12_14605 [Chryseobacterium camelliae]|uniref:ASCH domain-containing protein n=1 Tax=Chryseobacterium camelliae TaxID=1265445 RepID=A0ABY7QKQ0_9FLAO|nr:hypothetical protein [Chryseobacterium camelliae]WBV60256.1 hypothetical protein PFY12_14605 [Chryseobacterium camelliae]
MNLQLPLKKQWFEMTKSGFKSEDYREITPYWIKRLTDNDIDLTIEEIESGLCALRDGYSEEHVYNCYGFWFKPFTKNTMTLGYPKKGDPDRIIQFEHAGIEIREGNPEWGAEPGKIYFVIKHGKQV